MGRVEDHTWLKKDFSLLNIFSCLLILSLLQTFICQIDRVKFCCVYMNGNNSFSEKFVFNFYHIQFFLINGNHTSRAAHINL